MSLREWINSEKANQHPWDWISHGVMALVLWTPFAVTGNPWMGVWLNVGLWFGREEFQYWRSHDKRATESWNPLNWSTDSKIDFILPVVVVTATTLTMEYFK